MAEQKTTKVITKRRKFIPVEIPLLRLKIDLIGNSAEEIKDKTIKMDLTRQLKGKSAEMVFKIGIENNKAVAQPREIKLLSYFIRRMIRKRISYVEDSFEAPSQESMLLVKPFLITRKKVSRAVRKTLRNKCKNWVQDYISQKKDIELFEEILSGRFQRMLSLMLKKTYPLSLCEIRILDIKRPLKSEEIPKIKEKPKQEEKIEIEEGIDQLKEIEDEKIKKAEKEIQEAQKKAAKIESSVSTETEIAASETATKKKKKAKETKASKEE